jgi:GNAT superfamily N-acetyltransferase
MDRLAQYFREREDFDCILRDEGFATYKISGDECYIKDIFVSADYRKKGIAAEMADDIARIAIAKGCKYLTGSVCTTANGAHASLLVLLAYGFKIHSAVQYGIYFRKTLEEK